MKIFRHIFVVLLLLFISTTATAQSQSDNTDGNTTTAVRADVNGDGVVNEADITEILAIIKNNNDTKYYWYVGQSDSETFLTTENYKSISTTVSKYEASQTFTVNDKYLYLIVLADKSVEAIGTAGGSLNFKYLRGNDNVYIPVANDKTLITLDDGKIYRIYRSASMANDKYTITIQ